MRGVFSDALLHNRAALFLGCRVALDGSQYSAHLFALFKQIAQSCYALTMESFLCFTLAVIHAVRKLNTTRPRGRRANINALRQLSRRGLAAVHV
jgi:hypothetical protein